MAESLSELQAEIEKLERKHAENPEGRFFVPLADAYRKTGAGERAEALLRAGLQRHPEYLSAHIVLGRSLADRGAHREAEAEFRYVLSLDPQNLVALRTLGEMALADGRREEAGGWFRELLAVDPLNEEARRRLDELRARAAEAPPAAERAEVAPRDEEEAGEEDAAPASEAVVTETIAELYYRQGFQERAAEVYRELIRRRGGDRALELRLAEIEQRAGADAEPTEEPLPPVPEWIVEPAEPVATLSDDDLFADSFSDGFFLDLPEAEPRAAEEPTIRAYLADLLAWRPGQAPRAAAEPEAAAEPAGTAPAAEDPFPWEVEAPESAADDEAALFSLDEFFTDAVPAAAPAPPVEPQAAPAEAPAPAQDEGAGSEDDDLESFQAWLRSLKR